MAEFEHNMDPSLHKTPSGQYREALRQLESAREALRRTGQTGESWTLEGQRTIDDHEQAKAEATRLKEDLLASGAASAEQLTAVEEAVYAERPPHDELDG